MSYRRRDALGRLAHGVFLLVVACTMAGLAQMAAAAPTLTASLNLRPNMGLYKPGESVSIQFNATEATVGWQLKITVKDEHETVLATQNYNVSSATWNQSYTAPNGSLGFYRVYASLYNGSTEMVKLSAPNASRLNGFLTYAIVPNPAQRPASIPEAQAAFGMQGGFNQSVGTDIFAFLGVRWDMDGGWKWKNLSPSIGNKFNGSNPPSAIYPWATNGAGGSWTVYNMPNLLKDGRPYGGSPDVYKPNTFEYNTGALRTEYEPDWSDFCEAVAESWPTVYPNRTQPIYEITWEPIHPWGYKGTPQELVRIYQLAYPAIKSGDPDAWVLGPCMHINTTGNLNRIYELLDLGLGNYIDAFSVHPYMDSDNGWNLREPELAGQPSLIRTMKNKLRGYIGHDIPLLGTEQGYRTRIAKRDNTTNAVINQPALGTQPDLSAELRAAQRLIRSQLITLGQGYRLNIAFYIADYPNNDEILRNVPEEHPHFWDWGLFYNLSTPDSGGYGPSKIGPKPVAPAYAAMTFLLENRKAVCEVNWLGDTVRGYAFEHFNNNQDVVLALWNFEATGTSADNVTIDTGVAQVDIYDWMGNKTTQSTSGGMLTVALGEEPIYIKGVDADLWGSSRPFFNVARGKSVTVSSQPDGNHPGNLAVDGDSVSYLSRWVSQSGSAAQWIEVNLGDDYEINEVRFWTGEYSTGPNGALGHNTYKLPLSSYQIQRWNGSAWVNIVSRTSNTKAVVTEKFSPVTTSKVRLYVPAASVDAVKLYELEIMSTTPVDEEPDPGNVISLSPVADSQVQAGTGASTNFGTDTTMRARYDGPGANNTYDSFLRFDLSGVSGTVTQAKLILHPTQVTIWQNAPLNRVQRVGSDSWGESTITWNNKPSADSTVLGEWGPVQGTPAEIDITSTVLAEMAGDGVLSLRVYGVNWDGANVFYGTRENAAQTARPVLQLTISTATASDVSPEADAYVQSGTPSTNYGTAANLVVKSDWSGSASNRHTYLRFNLAGVGPITNAKLILHPTTVDMTTTHQVQLVSNDTWGETSINWSNKPASSGVSAGEWSPTANQEVQVDVTALAQAEQAGDGKLSLRIHAKNWDAAYAVYGARENASQSLRPVLRVTSDSGAPAPTTELTAVADSQVQAGTGASTNFGTDTAMRARYDGPGANNTYDSYVRFDLSGVTGAIEEAKLVLYPSQVTIWQNSPVNRVQRVASDSWGETTITWNNKPSADSTVLGEWGPAQGTPVEVDITAAVQAEAAGDGVLSLRVYGVNWDGANVWYSTREATTASQRPKLIINP